MRTVFVSAAILAVIAGSPCRAQPQRPAGARLWVPFGVAWIPDFSASGYNPAPDPDHKIYSLTLHYGLEFSRSEYPVYLAINKVIISGSNKNDMKNAFDEAALRKWRTPDMKDLLNMWTFAFGIKTTMF